ncbi:hypothetical protein BC940DRAFT_105357 [Gongronella butleri]|nr:hypothetical protein BC940DRAFT_105357 [Gongronella butleri]
MPAQNASFVIFFFHFHLFAHHWSSALSGCKSHEQPLGVIDGCCHGTVFLVGPCRHDSLFSKGRDDPIFGSPLSPLYRLPGRCWASAAPFSARMKLLRSSCTFLAMRELGIVQGAGVTMLMKKKVGSGPVS